MNIIKRVIDAKRWPEHTLVSSEEANSALDYIKEAVTTYVTEIEQALGTPRKTVLKAKEQRIAELEKRIAELETGVNMYKQSLKTQTAYTDNATKAVMVLKADAEKRIAELENLISLAEENRRFHRANVEKSTDGSLNICWGEHEKWEDCEYVRYYPEQRIAELEAQVPNVVTPVNGKCPNCGGYCGWGYCCHCGAKLEWT